MMPTAQVLIAVGSNLGDRDHHIASAMALLEKNHIALIATSSVYETAPIGAADLPFLNGVVLASTALSPLRCMQTLLQIEEALGRERQVHWGNRTIDLDILLWRDVDGRSVTVTSPELQIPHPKMLERDFVLVPSAEIAAEWIFPGAKLNLAELRRQSGFALAAPKSFPAFA